MSLSVGIVGLPNVGKSTLFNALTKRQQAAAENYPFCTIEPNAAIVEVADPRLEALASGFDPLSIEKGLMMFAACMPIAIVGYFSAIAQGKTAAAGVSIIAKKPDQNGKAITMAAMVETYAVIALLVSILSIFSISGLNI